ncbi:nuclease-like protein [Ureibacillus xyleni]|uniref:Nuclease-like protein n=1 Tax=Ureibacillus xyleni TaxID=614648 RepID=A0A285TE41_9BACL|nr:nuclease-related domain-containing protein [Ureibacillus xyleni]SOC18231.1 nuclease-like protein [Ureibacillus xyleni]
MIIWFLILVLLIGIFFAISLYIYDNSKFSKITGYSYISLLQKETRAYYKLVTGLQKAKGEYEILLNVVLPSNNVLVDAIFVHQSGIYIINFKHMTGWIYGRENDPEWAEVQYREKLHKFDNPLIENKIIISDLKQLLDIADAAPFYSIAVFSDNCSFKKIEVQSKNTEVMKLKELNAYWKESSENFLSKEEISKIYQELNKYKSIKNSPKKTKASQVVAN